MKMFTILLLLTISLQLSAQVKQSEHNENQAFNPISTYNNMDEVMKLAEMKPTILFFKADWCPPCRSASKDFHNNKNLLQGVNIVVVNYDRSSDLKKKYGVTYQHTFVQVSPTGESINKWNGGSTKELLKRVSKGDM